MRDLSTRATRIVLSVLALSAVSACLDEQVVYEDKAFSSDPPSAAESFLGYANADTRQTVCGTCHIEKQGQWENTAHSGAWATLQDSGHAEEFCEACHTVNALGNFVVADAGHVATGDERYQDVQCEACHGPGLEHVLNPTKETVPLAPMAVGVDLTTGCGQCHQGTHHPFVEEWAQSRHGSVNVYPAGQRGTCDQCHTGEGALEAWGINTRYPEKDRLSQPGEHMAITCAVCHDAHGGSDHAQLRFPVDVPSVELNLCMKCHHERGTPDPTNERGPHSPEGPVLLGHAGWRPPGLGQALNLVGPHGDTDVNPTLCARCHVSAFGVTDANTGEFAFQATGHLFTAIPCLDSEGKPEVGADCDDQERSFRACAGSGCHQSAALASAARTTAESRMAELVVELRALIDQIPRTEFNPDDDLFTVGEGSRFNAVLGVYTGSAVHNPVLIEALLLGSIEAMELEYGLTAASSFSRTPLFKWN